VENTRGNSPSSESCSDGIRRCCLRGEEVEAEAEAEDDEDVRVISEREEFPDWGSVRVEAMSRSWSTRRSACTLSGSEKATIQTWQGRSRDEKGHQVHGRSNHPHVRTHPPTQRKHTIKEGWRRPPLSPVACPCQGQSSRRP
jgi:hypothetical protein